MSFLVWESRQGYMLGIRWTGCQGRPMGTVFQCSWIRCQMLEHTSSFQLSPAFINLLDSDKVLWDLVPPFQSTDHTWHSRQSVMPSNDWTRAADAGDVPPARSSHSLTSVNVSSLCSEYATLACIHVLGASADLKLAAWRCMSTTSSLKQVCSGRTDEVPSLIPCFGRTAGWPVCFWRRACTTDAAAKRDL